jgi:hypothetical protein
VGGLAGGPLRPLAGQMSLAHLALEVLQTGVSVWIDRGASFWRRSSGGGPLAQVPDPCVRVLDFLEAASRLR